MLRVTIVIMLAVLLSGSCSPDRTTGNNGGGGASETVATVTTVAAGINVAVSGDSACTLEVTICSSRYSAIDSDEYHLERTMAGPADTWSVSSLDSGTYYITVSDLQNATAGLFICVVNDSLLKPKYPQRKKLVAAGTVTGTLRTRTADGQEVPVVNGTVCLKGTLFSTVTGEDGGYRIDGIPAGTYIIDVQASERTYTKSIEVRTVSVSGDSSSTMDITLTVTN